MTRYDKNTGAIGTIRYADGSLATTPITRPVAIPMSDFIATNATDTTAASKTDAIDLSAIRSLQRHIGEANAAKGFHEDGQALRVLVSGQTRYEGKPESIYDKALRSHWISRLALITTEVAEAIEEVRAGQSMRETYYSGGYQRTAPTVESLAETDAVDHNGAARKPEGVPSELADVVIRALDLAHEANIDLAAMIAKKLAYNASRPFKHGKKA